jgi:predicted AAA+ superfamily ATPase
MKNTDKEVRDVIENLQAVKELDTKEYETIMHRTKKFDELDKLISKLKELSESFNDNPDDLKFHESEHLVSKLKKLAEGFKDNPDDFLFITYLEKGDQSYRTVCSD